VKSVIVAAAAQFARDALRVRRPSPDIACASTGMRKGAPTDRRPFPARRVIRAAAQFRGLAVRSLPPDDELPLLDEEPLPDVEDGDGAGGGLYVVRGRSDGVPVELPCVWV